ncbi:MAG: dTMP kinase [Burkholderiales bacterium]|jgi:dTMP kinase|nr:dTMP kinase [Burkholderiales bacterium]
MVGQFITLEGIDGAGKSTHAEFIAQRLRSRGRTVVQTREPGGTVIGEKIRSLVLSEAMDVHAETLLVFAARSQHLADVVRPALASGSTVLCDRFTDATFAYQCGGRGVSEHYVETLARLSHGDLSPDLTLLFDADASTAHARVVARSATDRFEREDLCFFERVRARYLEQARREPARFCVLDAGRPIEDVQAAIARALDERIG